MLVSVSHEPDVAQLLPIMSICGSFVSLPSAQLNATKELWKKNCFPLNRGLQRLILMRKWSYMKYKKAGGIEFQTSWPNVSERNKV